MADAWEWDLEGGATIIARLELPARVESVWLGQRLVSRSGAGGKGADHVVPLPAPKTEPPGAAEIYRAAPPPGEAIVTFDPIGAHCTLRLDGVAVPPTRAPEDPIAASSRYGEERAPRILGMPRRRAVVVLPIAAALLCALIAPPTIRSVIARRARSKIADAPAETTRTEYLESPDGSMIAHFPADFDTTVDEQGAFISLHRPKKLEMLVLISTPRSDLADAHDLDKIMTKDLASFAAKTGAVMSTTITVDGDCHGFPGVISTATLSKPEQSDDLPLEVVSCTALQNGRGYFFAYLVPEFLAEREGPELRRIIDATDLFDVAPPNLAAAGAPRARAARAPLEGNSGFLQNGQFGAIPPPPPAVTPITTLSPRGVRTTPQPMPQPRMGSNGPTPTPAPTPMPAIRLGANGSVEGAGPQHVNGVNRAADAANDAKMRSYRKSVPW